MQRFDGIGRLIGSGVLCALLSGAAFGQKTLYVAPPGQSTPLSPFATEATAASSINTAVNTAADGDTVIVLPGTYLLTTEIIIKEKGVTVRSRDGRDVTIVNAQGLSRGFYINHVLASVEGFTIRNGVAPPNPVHGDAYGGGVYIEDGGTVRDCIIENCTADYGGGVRIRFLGEVFDSVLRNNTALIDGGGLQMAFGGTASGLTVHRNSATGFGGGIYLYDGGSVELCNIYDNQAWYGGGVRIYFVSTTRPEVTKSRIHGNRAIRKGSKASDLGAGGGVQIERGGVIRNCLVYDNEADAYGGGVHIVQTGSTIPAIMNCTISHNRTKDTTGDGNGNGWGGGLYTYNGGLIVNSIIYYNQSGLYPNRNTDDSAVVYRNNLTSPSIIGNGNLFAQLPQFVDPIARNYYLLPTSPCIDKGTSAGAPSEDFAGTMRPLSGSATSTVRVVDIGAYEYFQADDIDQDGMPTWWELYFGLDPNNPADADLDYDEDGLTNLEEYQVSEFYLGIGFDPADGLDPFNPDTDGDGLTDGQEVKGYFLASHSLLYGDLPETNPLEVDTDGDGFDDLYEYENNTHPTNSASFSASVSGTISYSGTLQTNGPVYITIAGPAGMTAKGTVIPGLGTYTVTNVPTILPLTITAYRDGDVPIGIVGVWDTWEPYGEYDENPLTIAGSRSGVNIVLHDPESDSDNDGLSDYEEIFIYGTLPFDPDTDGDGMPDGWEVYFMPHLDPRVHDGNVDFDNDGLTNLQEYQDSLDVLGLGFDPAEGLDPTNPDSDGDGLPDGWEVHFELDPLDPSNAERPSDVDDFGMTNLDKYRFSTNYFGTIDFAAADGLNPNAMDTDGDGMPDWWEVYFWPGRDPISDDPFSPDPLTPDGIEDPDYDDLTNLEEYQYSLGVLGPRFDPSEGLDPTSPDTDGDGLPDGWEVRYGLNPLDDSDAGHDEEPDGLTNLEEFQWPPNAEFPDGLDPTNWDTDGDGVSDGDEVIAGTDPLDPDSFPVVLEGTVHYSGIQTGTVYVTASRHPFGQVYTTTISTPGDYVLTGVANATNYLIHAYIDHNGSGAQNFWEAEGFYSDTNGLPLVFMPLNALTEDLDITLSDPDDDGDGIPDLLEITWSCYASGMVTRAQWLAGEGDTSHYDPYHPVDNPTGTDLNHESVDTDGDGLPDAWEAYFWPFVNPLLDDAGDDWDNDDLTNWQEYDYSLQRLGAGFDPAAGLHPGEEDTDGDGFSDGDEWLIWDTDPLNIDSFPVEVVGSIVNATMAPHTGMVYVVLNLESNANHFATYPVGVMTNAGPLPFTIQYVPNQTGYWVHAYLDLEGNDDQDSWDPIGFAMGGTVPILAVTNVDAGEITIEDSIKDSDGDGLTDYDERFIYGTNPFLADTDGDTFRDYDEIFVYGTDPTNSASFPAYIGGALSYAEGFPGVLMVTVSNDSQVLVYNFGNYAGGTYRTPTNLPTLTNYTVTAFLDSNTNGVLDIWEARGEPGGNPYYLLGNVNSADILLEHTENDWDGDGLLDHEEHFIHGTDPYLWDTDGDTFNDYDEIFLYGTDPRDADSFPVSISGEVFYTPAHAGAQTGTIYVTAVDVDEPILTFTVTLPGPGSYTLMNLPAARTYDVSAYLDDNGDGELDATWEAQAVYASGPVLLTNTLTGIDMTLEHPLMTDSDNDGVFDYDEEYVHGSGPMNPDTSSDGVPDGWLVHFGLDPLTNWFGVTLGTADMTVTEKYDYSESVLAPGWDVQDGLGFNPADGLFPALLDTDGDLFGDGEEITWLTDPLDLDSYPIEVDVMIFNATVAPQAGHVYVVFNLESNANPFATFDLGLVTNAGAHAFNIQYVPNRTEYWISAYMDIDGNGLYDGWDPYGAAFNGTNSVTPTNDINVGVIPLTDSTLDSDEDGLTDFDEEFIHGTDPNNWDTDGDGFSDYDEIFVYGTDPNNPASFPAYIGGMLDYTNGHPGVLMVVVSNDSQTLVYNFGEYAGGTYSTPTNLPTLTNYWVMAFIDSNTNGVLDLWEARGAPVASPFDPLMGGVDNADILLVHPDVDTDGDDLTDYEEYFIYGTDPELWDTDGDDMPDGWEVANNLDPLVGTGDNGADGDPDGDGLRNYLEYLYGTDPWNPDTDGDGLSDLLEVTWSCYASGVIDRAQWLNGEGDADHYDPYHPVDNPTGTDLDALRADTDGDGIPDGWETYFWPVTNPLSNDAGDDPDGDGLTNIEEYEYGEDRFGSPNYDPADGLDPGNPDTDGDSLSDGDEVLIHGTDPLDPDSDGDGFDDYDEIMNIGSDPLNEFDPVVVDAAFYDPSLPYPEENGSLQYPFDAIQKGVDAASPGFTVLVMDGVYQSGLSRNINPQGKALTIRSRNGATNTTIRLNTGNGFRLVSGETEETIIQGFTIQTGVEDLGSAGILVDGSSPIIRECRFFDCGQAGILVRNRGNPTIQDCLFEENQGAIKIVESDSLIERCILRNNVDGDGGGLFISGSASVTSQPIIVNSLIVNNTATNRGGGIYAGEYTFAIFINNTVADNHADLRGGGIFNAGDTAFLNGILWGNTAPDGPGFSLARAFDTAYSVMQTSRETSTQVITNNPQFVSSDNYALLSSSPAIDLGIRNFGNYDPRYAHVEAPSDDIKRNVRPQWISRFPGYDVGAYEYQPGGALYLQPISETPDAALVGGITHMLQWTYDGSVGTNVNVEYNFEPITSPNWQVAATNVSIGTGSAGSYAWMVPSTNTTRCYVRIVDTSDPLITSVSERFGITNGLVLYAPQSDVQYYLGNALEVAWVSSPAVNTNVQLVFNAGLSSMLTNAAHVSGGSTNTLYWPLGQREKDLLTTNGLVTVSSAGLRSASSGGGLTVLGLVVTLPGPGANLQTGTVVNVNWTGLGAGPAVNIRYSDDGGVLFTVVSNGVLNVDGTNTFAWLVPEDVATNAVLEVASATDSNVLGWTWFEVSDIGGASVNIAGDGIPDIWKITHGLDPANQDGISGADDDPDGDGVSNYYEWLAGTDPLNGSSFFGILALEPVLPIEDGALEPADSAGFVLRWRAVPGKKYIVQAAAHPAGAWVDVSVVLEASGTELQWTDAFTPGQRFYRIRLLVD